MHISLLDSAHCTWSGQGYLSAVGGSLNPAERAWISYQVRRQKVHVSEVPCHGPRGHAPFGGRRKIVEWFGSAHHSAWGSFSHVSPSQDSVSKSNGHNFAGKVFIHWTSSVGFLADRLGLLAGEICRACHCISGVNGGLTLTSALPSCFGHRNVTSPFNPPFSSARLCLIYWSQRAAIVPSAESSGHVNTPNAS
jgi:hypothetical protein